jgi:hypothetical protein
MADLQLYKSLTDVSGLGRMRKVCARQGVEFVAIGGLVRNLARWMVRRGPLSRDIKLFDCVPFLSDIDLLHNAEPEDTPRLTRALLRSIPFAEYFRWQVRSAKQQKEFAEALRLSNVIPVNLMSLSTAEEEGIRDPWDGARDLRERKYRFIRNGFYKESPLYRKGRDVEIFSTLMYYRVLLEDRLSPKEIEAQPGLDDARRVIEDACANHELRIRLEDRAYLRMRLKYLLAGMMAVADSNILEQVRESFRLDRLQSYLGHDDRLRFNLPVRNTLTTSPFLGGDTFRLPSETEQWRSGMHARREMQQALEQTARPRQARWKAAELGEGQTVLLASPRFTMAAGTSRSSMAGPGIVQEFLHFAIPVFPESHDDDWYDMNSNDLSVIGVLHATRSWGDVALLFSPPAVVSWGRADFDDSRKHALVRINCAGLFEHAEEIADELGTSKTPTQVQFFVVHWRSE